MSPTSFLDRYGSRVAKDPKTGCWLWTGAKNVRGYGIIRIATRSTLAHRVAYEASRGPIPDGLELDHLCRVHNCINPGHLEAVSHHVNVLRGRRCDRASHCKRGHALHGDNLYWSRPGTNRACKTCVLDRSRARYAARKEAHASH